MMKRLLLFATAVLLWAQNGYGQQYSDTTAFSCIVTEPDSLSFSINQVPPPSSAATITFYYQGDLNSSTETFTLYDENGNSLGTNASTSQCGGIDSTTFTVPLSTLSGWVTDGTINFGAESSGAVSSTLCNPGSCAQIKIEYTPVTGPNDAGVVSIPDITQSCPGNGTVEAVVLNFGTNQITTLDVNWSVNGVVQSPVSYSGTLDTLNGTGSARDTVSLGSYNFSAGSYTIEAWTSNPNGVADTVNLNDSTLAIQSPVGAPQNFTATAVNDDSVTLSWSGSSPVSYDIIYGTNGFNPATGGTTVNTTASPYTVSGLSPLTRYDFYLVGDCGSGSYTDTAGPLNVRTLCGSLSPATLPVFEDFEAASGTFVGSLDGVFCTSDAIWDFETDEPADGRLSFDLGYSNTTNGANDTVAASMDEVSTGNPVNYLIGTYDLSNYDTSTTDFILLNFYHLSHGDEGDAPDKVWVRGDSNASWIQVYDLDANAISGQWVYSNDIDLTATLRTNSQNFSSSFQVRFGQEDNSSITSPSGIDGRSFDDITIDKVSCLDIANVDFTNVTNSSFTVSEAGNPNANFQVEWGPCGFQQGTGTVDTSSNGSFTATGLAGNSCYEVFIRRDCGASGLSSWTGPFTIFTLCNPFTAPYSNNFDNDSVGQIPNCWDAYLAGGNTQFADVFVEQASSFEPANSAPNHVDFYNYNLDTTWLITPEFSDMTSDSNRVRFFAKSSSSFTAGDLIVGTISSPGNPGSFSALDTFFVNDTYQEFTADITSANGYNGTHTFVVLAHAGGSFDNYYIDDFVYETKPACQGPQAAQTGVSSVTATSANIFWGGGQGDTTKIVWGAPGFTPATGAIGTGFAAGTDTTFTITGLAAQTTYEFYLQDSCAASGAGIYIGPFSFTTACLPLTAPVTENFDNTSVWSGTTLDPCWSSNGPGGFAHQWEANSGSTGSSSTGPNGDNTTGSGQYLYTETSSSSPNTAILTSPLIDVSGLNVPYLKYFYHRYGSDMGDLDVEVNDGSGWSVVASYSGQDQTSSSDPWQEVGIDISSFGDTVAVRFVSTRGSSFRGDGAIDDFSVIEAPACPKPTNLTASNATDSSAVLNWNTVGSANGYEVWVGPTGFYQGTLTVGGFKTQVTGGSLDSLLIDTLSSNTCYEFLVRATCGPGDTSDWVGPVTFCTECSSFNTRYLQTFDNWPVSCWNVALGSVSWVSYAGPSGDNYAEASFWSNNGDSMIMSSPLINVGSSQHRVQFDWSHSYNSFYDDRLVVLIEDVATGSRDTLKDLQGSTFDDPSAGSTSPGNFINEKIQLATSYNGKTIKLYFKGYSDWGPNLYINDVSVEKIPTCFQPDSISATNITLNSADINWVADAQSTGNNFVVSYGVGISAPGAGTQVAATGSSTTLTGLSSSSTYSAWVREVCSPGDSSFWQGPVTFSTPCTTFNLPYFEGFSSTFPACWNTNDPQAAYVTNACSGNVGYSLQVDGVNGTYAEGPVIDAGSLDSVKVYFEYRKGDNSNCGNNPETSDSASLEYYDGSSWKYLYSFTTNSPNVFTPDSVIIRTGLTANFQVRLFHHNGSGNNFDNFNIDSISVVDASGSCQLPTGLDSVSTTCDSLTVSWTSNTGGSILQYGPAGFTPGNGALTGVVTSPYTIAGLNPGTAYDVWVADTCQGDTTSFTSLKTVTTANAPQPMASFVDSTGIVGGVFFLYLDAGASMNADTYQWNFGNGSTGSGMMDTIGYNTNGTYTVSLVVSNACGTDTLTDTVNVNIGLAENPLQANLSIFPNPTDGIVQVEAGQVGDQVLLRLTDMRGSLILRESEQVNARTYQKQLDISELPKGIYILEVETKGMKARRRINLR